VTPIERCARTIESRALGVGPQVGFIFPVGGM
jgi:hypothetical protein